jgi:hypothetical protein
MEAPRRTKLRRDIEDPKFRKSNTAIDDPIRPIPKTDNALPKRKKPRKDTADPILMKSRTDMEDPKSERP